jgi:hypothetical protein
MAQIGKAAIGDTRGVRPSAAQMTQFLEALAESSNVAASARAAGMPGNAMYRERRRNAGFAARWHEALCEGFARLEAELLSEALVAPSGNVKDATLKSRAQKYRLGLALLAAHRAAVRGAKLPGGSGGGATQGSAKERLRAKLYAMQEQMEAEAAGEAERGGGA